VLGTALRNLTGEPQESAKAPQADKTEEKAA
jgi:hypothetical protein